MALTRAGGLNARTGTGRMLPLGDFTGAFGDSAVLLPLLLALAWQTGASAVVMLVTTGLAYCATGWLFRLPIPVQPLKSLSIVAIASGATLSELQVAGVLLGTIYLLVSFMDVDRLARIVPDALVHGFQLGLGVMLLLTALGLLGATPLELAIVIAAGAVVVLLTRCTGLPLLGAVALGGIGWGLFHAEPVVATATGDGLRASLIGMMVLPQIALTLTNSVLGTHRAAQAYYGERAARVTPRRLLTSLGLGNIAVGLVGGMPYCHGSGGVTAHRHAGARTWRANMVMGAALLALAGLLLAEGGGLPAFPGVLQAMLIGVIGVFHLQLSGPSWRRPDTAALLIVMGAAALLAQSMLAVLVSGVAGLGVGWLLRRHGRLPRAWPPRVQQWMGAEPPGDAERDAGRRQA